MGTRNTIPLTTQVPSETTFLEALGADAHTLPNVVSIVQVGDLEKALIIATRCFSILVSWNLSHTKRRKHFEAAIDSLNRLSRITSSVQQSTPRHILEEIYPDIMSSVSLYLKHAETIDDLGLLQASNLACQTIGHALALLFGASRNLQSTLPASICWSLTAIVSASSKAHVWRTYHQLLSSLILECIEDDKARQHRDLQVNSPSKRLTK